MGTPLSAPREALINAVSLPDEDIDLVRAALCLAAEEHRDLDIVYYEGVLSLLSRRAREKMPRRPNFYDAIAAINSVLFDEEGYRGNSESYYDPRNSYLNQVIDHRTGIPISLSIIYLDIAARLGQRFRGIGMQSHFLIAAGQGAAEIYIDPFNRGGLLSRREAILMALRGRQCPAEQMSAIARKLLPVFDRRMVLRRMLNNLKHIYLKEKDHGRGLRTAECIQVLDGNDWRNLSEIARLQTELGRFTDAAASLSALIERAPAGTDMKLAEDALKQLRTMPGGKETGGAPA